MTTVQTWLLGLGGVATAVLAIMGLVRATAGPRVRLSRFLQRMERANDVVLGSPEIPDPNRPGEVLREAIPDIGVRMTKQETLLEQFVVGAVEEAKHAAITASEAAVKAQSAADEARRFATVSAGRFDALSEKVDGLTGQVTEWQERDRVEAEVAKSTLHEIGMTMPIAKPRRDDAEDAA